MFDFLLPAHVKEGKQLLIGVKKFVHQHRDLMSEEKISAIMQARDEFAAVLETRDKDKLEKEKAHLLSVCEKAVPDYKTDSIRENIEVIIVAIVVALGIRSYIVQPFKIPTASMQPTLNGIVATQMPEGTETPNVVAKAWGFVWSGTNYTELRAPEATGDLYITAVQQQAFAMLFTRSIFHFSNGETAWSYAPVRQILGELWLNPNNRPLLGKVEATDSFMYSLIKDREGMPLPPERDGSPVRGMKVPPGAILARGRVDTGDQVLVDKVSYHFRQPKRGEPFVFSTKGIRGIEATFASGTESQHYIKRLGGVPHDTLELDPPYLWINGEMPKEFGIKRVIEHEGDANAALSPHVNKYHGYTMLGQRASNYEIENANTQREGRNTITYRLHEKEYMAFGDNSGNSSDSRAWGKVPQANLVGPALMVYWPFKPHAGLIK
jgi:signal peptidase I